MIKKWAIPAAGICAGAVNGLFGAGGGMVLGPMLTLLVSLSVTVRETGLNLTDALPYLAGIALGGLAAGYWGKHIPVKWLHRVLGILILWGGVRNLC